MLQKLHVKNYALIDHLEVNFSDKMTIITGETGAGKSIILGALSLILGKRADTHILYDKKTKSVVEGTFNIAAYRLKSFFEKEELDYDDITHIRREITPSGKSRAFINDTPVRLNTLRLLSEQLVDLHAQHQTLKLQDSNYQLFVIDTLANHFDLLNDYKQDFRAYQKNINQLKKYRQKSQQLQKDLDYITFLVNEFEEAALSDPNEQTTLEKELKQLENGEGIKKALLESNFLLGESDNAVLRQLNKIKSAMGDISDLNKEYEDLLNRIDSVAIELEDVSAELNALEGDVEMDEGRTEQVSERLTLLYRLQKKHNVNSVAELLAIETGLQADNQAIFEVEEQIKVLEEKLATQKITLLEKAQQLSKQREAQIPQFEKRIDRLLTKVGMPNATIKTSQEIVDSERLTLNGMDEIELLFAANRGSKHEEIKKVASGGEMSRLMLCIKSLIAKNAALPTLIFDEIDTGISGEVALKVGNVMQELAMHHQVMCITHLPQIASKGNTHYFVYKELSDDRTFTRMKVLTPKGRIREVAKMLSGETPTKMALANAKELIEGHA